MSLLFPLLVSVFASAQPLPLTEAGGDFSAELSAKVRKSVLELVDTETKALCSVFPVTPDGEMLTALHCLRSCLAEAQAIEEASESSVGLQDLMVVKNPERTGLACPRLRIKGLPVDSEIKILATGPALALFDRHFTENHSGLYDELRSVGWHSKANDYAVIYVSGVSGQACLPMNLVSPREGESIHALGFALPQPEEGSVLKISSGSAFGSPSQGHYYSSRRSMDEKKWLVDLYSEPGLLIGNAWTDLGQSGGPLIDASGKAVGIASGFLASKDENGREVHEVVATSLERVFARLPLDLSKILSRENQKCR